MDAAAALAPRGGLIAAACTALGLSRASLHRREFARKQPPAPARARPKPLRALTDAEQQHILDMLRGPRFVDLAPAEIYACLLDEGVYLCSIRTMYPKNSSRYVFDGMRIMHYQSHDAQSCPLSPSPDG